MDIWIIDNQSRYANTDLDYCLSVKASLFEGANAREILMHQNLVASARGLGSLTIHARAVTEKPSLQRSQKPRHAQRYLAHGLQSPDRRGVDWNPFHYAFFN